MGGVLRKKCFFEVDYGLAVVDGGAGNSDCLVMRDRMQTHPCIIYYPWDIIRSLVSYSATFQPTLALHGNVLSPNVTTQKPMNSGRTAPSIFNRSLSRGKSIWRPSSGRGTIDQLVCFLS